MDYDEAVSSFNWIIFNDFSATTAEAIAETLRSNKDFPRLDAIMAKLAIEDLSHNYGFDNSGKITKSVKEPNAFLDLMMNYDTRAKHNEKWKKRFSDAMAKLG
jgi:hypothetical protein